MDPQTPADRPTLLTVDDEPEVLRAVERDLRRRYGREYRVLRADSGEAALGVLDELERRDEPVALLLVDQRMPAMNGVDFLERARERYPNARRVLLTAYADTEAAIAAINHADVDYYLLKPWDPPEEKLYRGRRRPLGRLAGDRSRAVRRRAGGGPPVVGPVPRGQGLPDPKPGALPLVRRGDRRRG